MKLKIIRITTVPTSLNKLLEGQLSFMCNYYEVIAVSSDQLSLAKVGKKEGVATYCVELTRKITPLQDLKALWELYIFFRKEKPLIVHTHTPKAGTVGMIAAWLARVPNRLHTIAGLPLLEAKGNKRKLLNFVEKITYSCATRVYPNSQGLKDIVIAERLTSSSKLKVLANGSSNGINTSYFNPAFYSEEDKKTLRKSLNLNIKDWVFVFVGRLVSDKGINELVSAFAKLISNVSDVKLLLVGPQEAELDPLQEETLQEIKGNRSIVSVGYREDVRPYLAISDVLVFPSYREGFPNVVMQAGAMGLPSIVTNINGCNEIIVDGENGTIIPVKDKNALYEAMELYITNRKYVAKLKENARESITSRYEQKIVWEALLAEYKLLEEKNV